MALPFCAVFSGADAISSRGVSPLCTVGFDRLPCAPPKGVRRSVNLDGVPSLLVHRGGTTFVAKRVSGQYVRVASIKSESPLSLTQPASLAVSDFEAIGLVEVFSTAKVCFCSFEARLEERSLDNRWVPPWLASQDEVLHQWSVTSVLDVNMFSISSTEIYAFVMRLSFLQGNLCHLLTNKERYVMGRWPVILLIMLCFVKRLSMLCPGLSHLDLPLSDSNMMMGGSVQCHFATKQVLRFGLNLHRLVLLWFKFSGLQPPWQGILDRLSERCSPGELLSIRGFMKEMHSANSKACCLVREKFTVETVARKRGGVVLDGTNAQIHRLWLTV